MAAVAFEHFRAVGCDIVVLEAVSYTHLAIGFGCSRLPRLYV